MPAKICSRFLVLICTLVAAMPVPVAAQGRINDHDLEALMRNLRDDAKAFRSPFESALKKSSIRKTSQEKDARVLAANFAKQTERMLNTFKDKRKSEAELTTVIGSAQQIDKLVYSLKLDSQVGPQWEKIRTETSQVATAFSLQDPFGAPAAAPATAAASGATPCLEAVGAERSKRLVDECLQVSPATHPPCNAQNSCVLIIDEIKRGCSLLGGGAPAFCAEYK